MNFIHTDLQGISLAILRDSGLGKCPLERATNFLLKLFKNQKLVLPAFNYDFPKSRAFNFRNDDIQVGAINNYLWCNYAFARTQIPIFSTISNFPVNSETKKSIIRPFSTDGIFRELIESQGRIVFYGANVSSLTFIHYLEEVVRVPYRYDKTFTGTLIGESENLPIALTYLVRPKGLQLEYDWSKIESCLRMNSVNIQYHGQERIWSAPVVQIRDLFLEFYEDDAMWPLSKDAKIIAQDKLQTLGRPFAITDFEEKVE